jgi:acyl transferase domain-containing protein
MVVEEAPARTGPVHADRPVLVPLSGRRPDAPVEYAAALARWLRGPGSESAVADVGYTLACARVHHPHRVALLVNGRDELLSALDLLVAGRPDSRRFESAPDGQPPEPAVRSAQRELLARLLDRVDGHPGADQLTALARLYVQGHRIDWTLVSGPDRHSRLSLPGYPFARDRHHVTALPRQADTRRDAGPVADLDRLALHQPSWLDAPVRLAADRSPADPVLVYDPAGDLADALDRAGSPSRVRRVAAAADVGPVVDELRAAGAGAVGVIVRLVGVGPGDEVGTGADLAAFETARAVLRGLRTQRLTTLLVTSDLVRADAAGALAQTLRQENPRLSGRAVLVPDGASAGADVILAELASPAAELGHLVDLRGGRRRRVLTPLELPAAGPAPRPDGVYLVSGGAGGIGLALARHLADRPGARVVLCGRSPVEALDPAARQVVDGDDRLRYVQADVRDRAAVDRLVREIVDRDGTLHGVFHAAGVVRDGYLVRKRSDEVAAVLEPKVTGAHHLDEATAHLPLDAFVLFSSVAAVSGNLGQSDYAYANGCLDGFAVRRAGLVARGKRSGRTLSVQWPLWDGPGMAIPEPVRAVVGERTGMVPLPAATALTALDRLLGVDGPAVVSLFHGDTARWRTHLAELWLAADPPREPAATRATAPAGAAGGDRAALRQLVCRTVADVLGRPLDSIRPQTSLESLGLDSVMIHTVTARLSAVVAPVGPEVLFGLRDLDELVDHLDTAPAAPVVSSPPRDITTAAPGTGPALPGGEPVDGRYAIVGISGRYPQAPDLDTFWHNLLIGKDTTSELPTDRWADAGGVRARGHFLSSVDAFDPAFFGLPAHEATLLDPQERLFLEVAWEALEDAGYTGERLDGLVAPDGVRRSMGVYVGITSSDYQLLGAERWVRGHRDMPSGHYWTLPNRLSYLLDLRGPSQPVDTACSSSLVALHLALDAMRRGDCAAALVGGVNLYLHPSRFRMLHQSGFLAEDGLCRSFGAGGQGFGPGEGVGAVLIKPLARAVADGDTVHAVVRGSAVAHGGRTNGFTAPSPWAQARVIRQALDASGVDPATVSVIEAHGTGTELGDPVELAGLQDTYGRGTAALVPCSLGSVKSASGHGESAAGIAALTKVVLQLRYRMLAPTLHADPVNPQLRLDETRFSLPNAAESWQPLHDDDGGELPRRAGISSFGAGGVNAHVIVEEFRPERHGRPDGEAPPGRGPGGAELVVLSAPSLEHLAASAGRLAHWLRGAGAATDLAAAARTLRTGRAAFGCRLAVVVRDIGELADALERYARGEDAGSVPVNDLREGGSLPQGLDEVPETAAFLADLWRNGRLQQIAALWLTGVRIDWGALTGGTGGPLVSLPPSAFVRRRLWIAKPTARDEALPPLDHPTRDPDPDQGLRMAADRLAPEASTVVAELVALVGDLIADTGAPVDTGRTLLELGIDSISLMNLRFALSERYGQTIPLQLLGESTVDTVAARLSTDHPHDRG